MGTSTSVAKPTKAVISASCGLEPGRVVPYKPLLDHAIDMAIDRSECADVNAQPAGDGGTHGFNIELLTLDLAGLDHVLGERREARLVTQGHADVSQAPHQ